MTAWGWLACCLTASQPERERERGKSLTKFELISKLSFNESSPNRITMLEKQTGRQFIWVSEVGVRSWWGLGLSLYHNEPSAM